MLLLFELTVGDRLRRLLHREFLDLVVLDSRDSIIGGHLLSVE